MLSEVAHFPELIWVLFISASQIQSMFFFFTYVEAYEHLHLLQCAAIIFHHEARGSFQGLLKIYVAIMMSARWHLFTSLILYYCCMTSIEHNLKSSTRRTKQERAHKEIRTIKPFCFLFVSAVKWFRSAFLLRNHWVLSIPFIIFITPKVTAIRAQIYNHQPDRQHIKA